MFLEYDRSIYIEEYGYEREYRLWAW